MGDFIHNDLVYLRAAGFHCLGFVFVFALSVLAVITPCRALVYLFVFCERQVLAGILG